MATSHKSNNDHKHGEHAEHPKKDPPAGATPSNTLPYASEPFGVYQPLLGWRSQLQHEHLSATISDRLKAASTLISKYYAPTTEGGPRQIIPNVHLPKTVDLTDTKIGRAIAKDSLQHQKPAAFNQALSSIAESVLHGESQVPRRLRVQGDDGSADRHAAGTGSPDARKRATVPAGTARRGDSQAKKTAEGAQAFAARDAHPTALEANIAASVLESQNENELAMAAVLQHVTKHSPDVVKQLFRPRVSELSRFVAAASLYSGKTPSQDAFLSPIGILHMFRQYFFELGTFLGPPVGHVWISPGGTVELIEANSKKRTIEYATESSTETINKSESNTTDKEELSDAVKDENASDMKLGVSATASGGVGAVFQASGTVSFNMDDSRKQAREQTHKKMREQSAKLSSEVRQNFKTTFRTVTESTDTSSRRYVLENKTTRLVSYELSQKMRKVGVQVQDLGQRLCWQLYIDNPGDPLGIGEFVHAIGDGLDPNLKPAEVQPHPVSQSKTFTAFIPFILTQGADHGATDTYVTYPQDPTRGWFDPDWGSDDIIIFKHEIKVPPAPVDFVFAQVQLIDFKGAEVKYDPNIDVDVPGAKFNITLTYAKFNGAPQIPFDVTVVYSPTDESIARIDDANKKAKDTYTDQLAAAKEKLQYDTLRERLKKSGNVTKRPYNDLREEERNVISRALVRKLYGQSAGASWESADYHVASEMIRYFFDIDAMLYFVAPDWWRPRTQKLVTPRTADGQFQPTIYVDPATSSHVLTVGGQYKLVPGHRPYYLITEETAPAPLGASLGWLIQLDGDAHRNAFLNSPWVKAVLPIRPGKERDAITFLRRPEVADTDGLDEDYPFDPKKDPAEYRGKKIKEVLLIIADKIAEEYEASLKPVKINPGLPDSKLALPTETVFAKGFDPLEGGIAFDRGAFEVFSEWTEVLPTDQVVATEYSLVGL